MKFKSLIKAIFILFLTFCKISQSYIYSVDFYKNDKIFLLGDIHLGMNDKFGHPNLSNEQLVNIHKKQALDLVNFIKRHDLKDCLVIVEDFFDIPVEKYKAAFENARKNYLEAGYSAIFDYLKVLCKKNNIKLINAEFRQMSTLCFEFGQITAGEFLNDLEKRVNDIQAYNDNSYLNNYYKKNLSIILNNNKILFDILRKNTDKFINQININPILISNFINDFFEILDLNIVHTIYKNRNLKHIFLVAGAHHTTKIKDALNHMGYNYVSTKKAHHLDPLNLKKTLQSTSIKKIDFNDNNSSVNSSNKLLLIAIIVADLLLKSGYVLFKRIQTHKKTGALNEI